MERTVDLENTIPILLPGLLELLNNRTFSQHDWKIANTKLVNQLIERESILRKGQPLKVETNIYDVIIGVIEGITSPFSYYQYLLILFHRLAKNLTEQERDFLRDTIYKMFIELDHKYRNFVAELSVLNNIRENNKDYRLIGIERDKIIDNTTADFTFEDTTTGEHELIEVVSIHAYNKSANFDLKRSIVSKIERKIADKTRGQSDHRPFKLVPVFWGMIEDLRRLNLIFKNETVVLPENVFEPMSLCSFDGPDFPVHRFVRISELFTDGEIQVVPGFN